MQCVILAGGFGTRIIEETKSIPKPMIEIGDKPIIWHIMKIFYHQGVRDFILSTGYKAEIIKKYFIDYYHTKNDIEINHNGEVEIIKNLSENWNIKVIDTGINTDTGGRIKGIKKFINTKKFFVTYGDGLCDINLQKLLKFHNKNKSLVTLTSIKNPSRFGTLEIDDNKIVKSFNEKSRTKDLDIINGGYFVMENKIFDFILNNKSNFEKDVLPVIVKKKKLGAYSHEGFWKCMDSLRDKNELEELWAKKQPWKIW